MVKKLDRGDVSDVLVRLHDKKLDQETAEDIVSLTEYIIRLERALDKNGGWQDV